MIHSVLGVILGVILLLTSVFWLWMLGDCVRNTSISGIRKLVWFLVIFFTHILGALAYFFFGRSTNKITDQPEGQPAPQTQQIYD